MAADSPERKARVTARKNPYSPDKTRKALEPQAHHSVWGRTTPVITQGDTPALFRWLGGRSSGPHRCTDTRCWVLGAGWVPPGNAGITCSGALGQLSRLTYSCSLPFTVAAESRLHTALSVHALGTQSSSWRPAWTRGERGCTSFSLVLTPRGSLCHSLLIQAGEDAPPT